MYRLFSLVALCAAITLFACAPAGAESLADKLQATYGAVNAMRADFTQVLNHKESGAREERSGVLYFKKPLLVRWETKKPSPELLLVGKEVIWNVFPDEEMAYKYALSMAEESGSLIRVITGQARLDQDYDLEDEGREGDLITVKLYPRQPSQAMVEALLWIDAKTHLIKKLRIYDFYGNENEIAFAGQDVKAEIKDSLFSYTPPKDFIVEDQSGEGAAAPRKPLLQ